METTIIKTLSDDEMKRIMKELMFKMYDGKSFQLCDLLDRFRAEIEIRNAEIPIPQKQNNLFYALMHRLEQEGFLKRIKYGVYYLSCEGVDDYSEEDEEEEENVDDMNEPIDGVRVIGEGDSYVYVYYYNCYKELARLTNSKTYPCKIGMTQDLSKRLSPKTDIPEPRTLGLAIRTNQPRVLEALLHNFFRLAGKQVLGEHVGTEWANTSPEEVEMYYGIISNMILNKSA